MSSEFQQRISILSNSDLIDVIQNKEKYQQEFWDLTLEEGYNRKLSKEEKSLIEEAVFKYEEDKILTQLAKEKEDDLPIIYSDKAIFFFSMAFTPIAGSILFAKNLKILNKSTSGKEVIVFGVSYLLLEFVILYFVPADSIRSFGSLLNIIGGFILTIYFGLKRYPKDLKYRNKKIWKPLFFSIIISGMIYFLFQFSNL